MRLVQLDGPDPPPPAIRGAWESALVMLVLEADIMTGEGSNPSGSHCTPTLSDVTDLDTCFIEACFKIPPPG